MAFYFMKRPSRELRSVAGDAELASLGPLDRAKTVALSVRGLCTDVTNTLSGFQALRYLSLNNSPAVTSLALVAALPPSLTELELDGLDRLGSVEPLAVLAPSLTALRLTLPAVHSVAVLTALTALRVLSMFGSPPAVLEERGVLDGVLRNGLRELRLGGHDLRRLPSALLQSEAARGLEVLHLRGMNNLEGREELPGALMSNLAGGRLRELHLVAVQLCEYGAVPPQISLLTSLQCVTLWRAKRVRQLPATLWYLPQLSDLNLESTDLREVPQALCRSVVMQSRLRSLSLSRVDLQQLPPELSLLTALQDLNLSEALDSDLYSGDELTASLAAALPPLVRLVDLSLAGNNLSALPPLLSRLTALRSLNLCDNRLADLPPELHALQLDHWRIEGNHALPAAYHTAHWPAARLALRDAIHRREGGPLPLLQLVVLWLNDRTVRAAGLAPVQAADVCTLPVELQECINP